MSAQKNKKQFNADVIPLEKEYRFSGPDENNRIEAQFFAFNTVITLQSYDSLELCKTAFTQARNECRRFELLFSRTLQHSDISNINKARGQEVEINGDTYYLLEAAKYYCEESQGRFDITMGSATALWDFAEKKVPDLISLRASLEHVDWKALLLRTEDTDHNDQRDNANREDLGEEGKLYFARLVDPLAALDVGGIAKGYIADSLTDLLKAAGLTSFFINLGGNTTVAGLKPGDALWRVGIQDPSDSNAIAATVETTDVSLVTSGIYERCFGKDNKFYHHILDTKTGFPVKTDIAGATAITKYSLDAEGFSTTLLALGLKLGKVFVKEHPEILNAIFIDLQGKVTTV